MGDSSTRNLPEAKDVIPPYHSFSTSVVHTERGKRVWEEVRTRYDPEGYTAEQPAGLDYRDFETLFREKRSREERRAKSPERAPSRLTIADLTAVELWQVIRPERPDTPVTIRAKAFAELMRRESEHGDLASFVVEQLAGDDLKPTWRNTLIFATEHLDFLDAAQRQRIRDLLSSLVTALGEEWHPRSRLAQEAALRRYGSLIDDKVQLGKLVRFLSTDHLLRVRLIALQTIQNAFVTAPPSVSLREDLKSLRDELQRMVDFFFRPQVLARSEEDFDLGLTALEALIRLGDPAMSQFIARVEEISRPWVAKQLARFLNDTRAAWPNPDSTSSSDPARAVRDALDALEAIES